MKQKLLLNKKVNSKLIKRLRKKAEETENNIQKYGEFTLDDL